MKKSILGFKIEHKEILDNDLPIPELKIDDDKSNASFSPIDNEDVKKLPATEEEIKMRRKHEIDKLVSGFSPTLLKMLCKEEQKKLRNNENKVKLKREITHNFAINDIMEKKELFGISKQ